MRDFNFCLTCLDLVSGLGNPSDSALNVVFKWKKRGSQGYDSQ